MTKPIIDPSKSGVSFSLKQCRNFNLSPTDCLTFLIEDLGFRRFRLMSYWDEHQPSPDKLELELLDEQIELIKKRSGRISLCLGVRQPRWPESHWPKWTKSLDSEDKYNELYRYLETIVKRYRSETAIFSWQLENEALNRNFGLGGDFNRSRLRAELKLVKKLDPSRPIIMSTSNTWGLPFRQPRPDIYGFTFYKTQFENGHYSQTKIPWWWPSFRAKLIKVTTGKPNFIHELQAEPWGPKAIWEMTTEEQDKSMNSEKLPTIVQQASRTKLFPIDLWGGEWWYWRQLHNQPVHHQILKLLSDQ